MRCRPLPQSSSATTQSPLRANLESSVPSFQHSRAGLLQTRSPDFSLAEIGRTFKGATRRLGSHQSDRRVGFASCPFVRELDRFASIGFGSAFWLKYSSLSADLRPSNLGLHTDQSPAGY